jgi:pyrroline-5-carboxylate reductase
LDSLAQGGADEGIAYPLSLTIATQTAESAVTLIKESGLQPQDLISRVSSAGGTTVEGIKALIDGNLQATVGDAVKKTAQRSRELEKEAANHTKRK